MTRLITIMDRYPTLCLFAVLAGLLIVAALEVPR